MIEIKHKTTGEVLKVVEAESLSGANLRGAKGTFIFNWGVKLKVVEE